MVPRLVKAPPYTSVLTAPSASPYNIQYCMVATEVPMRDLLLHAAGFIAILVSIVHGVLGETKVFARATIEPPRLRTLIRAVWQAGTVAWIGGGVLLLGGPWREAGADTPRD